MAERVAAMMNLVDQAIELINHGDAAYAADRLNIALRVGMFGAKKEACAGRVR